MYGVGLDYAFCACSRSFPGAVSRKPKKTIVVLLSLSEGAGYKNCIPGLTYMFF